MNFKISKANVSHAEPTSEIKLRCPTCRQRAVFQSIRGVNDSVLKINEDSETYLFGQRICSDSECRGHIFFVSSFGKIIVSYPAENIDFDSTDIPQQIIESFEEAIKCHASQCFTASAIMLRKTLEELCDERKAKGANLKKKIEQLGTKIVLPKELFDGLDDLRLLGNDAAHIESRVFNDIGQDEIEISVEFTKEVLKATYQYTTLLKKLRELKKKP